jgi:hypothetical protein
MRKSSCSLVLLVAAGASLLACKGDSGGEPHDAAGSDTAGGALDAAPGSDAAKPAADAGPAGGDVAPGACVPEGERARAPLEDRNHTGYDPTKTTYTNPPSSGPHCPDWRPPGVYAQAVPRCNWIHDLEHGYIMLLYNCPGGCPDIVQQLTALVPKIRDADCAQRRVIVTPDPELDVKVAAAAWGFTWKSSCLDAAALASLEAFGNAHIGTMGIAPEPQICN